MTDAQGRDVVRAYVKGAPDQLLARAIEATAPTGPSEPIDQGRDRYLAENDRLGEQGPARHGDRPGDFEPKTFDPEADCCPWSTA